MSVDDVIFNVIHIPKQFREGEKSPVRLLIESGYLEIHGSVGLEDILKGLDLYPECMEDWLIWSEDQRSSSHWFWGKGANNHYFVGFFPFDSSIPECIFEDKKSACSYFIEKAIGRIIMRM